VQYLLGRRLPVCFGLLLRAMNLQIRHCGSMCLEMVRIYVVNTHTHTHTPQFVAIFLLHNKICVELCGISVIWNVQVMSV